MSSVQPIPITSPSLEKHFHGTQFKFETPFNLIFGNSSKTFALDEFQLIPESSSICKIFCIIKNYNIRIKVQVQSTFNLDISSVVFYCASGKELTFKQFTTTSTDPYKCFSNEISGSYIYNFPSIGIAINSGFICYTAIQQNFLGHSLLKNSLEKGEYHDLIIKLDNGKEFKVHKMVLAFRSKVFKKIIDSEMMENKTGIIHIREVETDTMQEVLNHIYCLPCDLSNSPHSIFQAAHLYELNELTKLCGNYMMNNINYENFFEISQLVDIEAYELKHVSQALDNFLMEKEFEIVKDADFIESLANNMRIGSIHYLFRLCMQYNLYVKQKVIIFILNNLNKVLENSEFKKLFNNPGWSIEIFRVLGTQVNPGFLPN